MDYEPTTVPGDKKSAFCLGGEKKFKVNLSIFLGGKNFYLVFVPWESSVNAKHPKILKLLVSSAPKKYFLWRSVPNLSIDWQNRECKNSIVTPPPERSLTAFNPMISFQIGSWDGFWESLRGYWYWDLFECTCQKNRIRSIYGVQALLCDEGILELVIQVRVPFVGENWMGVNSYWTEEWIFGDCFIHFLFILKIRSIDEFF